MQTSLVHGYPNFFVRLLYFHIFRLENKVTQYQHKYLQEAQLLL